MASATASLVFVEAGFPDPVAALPVGLLVPEPLPVALAVEEVEMVGRLVNRAAELKVWQLLLEGILATYGMEVMGPRDSAGWV